jgi:hypothetical protein
LYFAPFFATVSPPVTYHYVPSENIKLYNSDKIYKKKSINTKETTAIELVAHGETEQDR